MSSRFFRSGGDDSSSDDDSSAEEDVRVEEEPRQIKFTTSKGSPANRGGAGPSLALSQPSLNSSHRDVLLHALLEERCVSEVLREHEWSRRGSADIRKEAQARYQRLCSRLAPLNLVSSGLEQESHAETRQAYRDGLNMLSGRSHPSIRQQSIVKAVTKLLTESVSPTVLEQLPEEAGPVSLWNQPRASTMSSSQYLRDFEEVGLLGKGGYGTVYHVRHRLDSHAYAVKKVRIDSSAMAQVNSAQKQHELEEVLVELRTLAKLEHPNVVRYYSSWVEWTTPSTNNRDNDAFRETTDVSEDITDSTGLHRVITADTDSDHDSGNFITFAEPSGPISEISKASSSSHRRYKSVEVSNRDTGANDGLAIAFEPTDGYSFAPSAVSESGFTASGFGKLQTSSEPCLALHIQMALYPMTLAEFLTPGLSPNVSKSPSSTAPPLTHCFHLEPSIRIMLALLDGVDYIHSRGIIHRDLKPANIFLRVEDDCKSTPASTPPKQGSIDLGLCEPCRAHTAPSSPPVDSSTSAGPNICICIGDFGLVSKITTPATSSTSALSSVMSPPMSPTSTANTRQVASPTLPPPNRVGTELYRPIDTPAISGSAPPIGPATDLFALGIIAFELLYPFSTQMERRTTLMNLRKGEFPDGFPELAREVIGEMLGFSCTTDAAGTCLDEEDKTGESITVEGLRKRLAGMLVEE
jgi:translation initiation factor 2-alpha kinase 3